VRQAADRISEFAFLRTGPANTLILERIVRGCLLAILCSLLETTPLHYMELLELAERLRKPRFRPLSRNAQWRRQSSRRRRSKRDVIWAHPLATNLAFA
jgi:hypothetical protein